MELFIIYLYFITGFYIARELEKESNQDNSWFEVACATIILMVVWLPLHIADLLMRDKK